jgi:hypothetical protein
MTMLRIVLSDLYIRQLLRAGVVTVYYQTLGTPPIPDGQGVESDIIVHAKRRNGELKYDQLIMASVVFAALVNPTDSSNHYWKITLRHRFEIPEL